MKKLFFLCAAALTLAANAETITLDLSTLTCGESGTTPIAYFTEDVIYSWYGVSSKDTWTGTYDENEDYLYANEGTFMFPHYGTTTGYTYYSQVTVSKVASDSVSEFACMGKGGLKGEGTPFLVCNTAEEGSTWGGETQVIFNDSYYPTQVSICQSTLTYDRLLNGDNVYCTPFTENDELMLIIKGYDEDDELTGTVNHNLAQGTTFKTTWETVDLSSLGKCIYLEFTMTSTDRNQDGMVTPAYFALDGLTISSDNPSTNINQTNVVVPKATKRIINGQLYIEKDGVLYTATGVRL